ncbi:MAG: hypothetical protein JSU65_05760 [Candidatus Zixiibacteriota bacterium]|nr:MAG: hypothetical protein JSU65_05760 [candidate division Zixibacteria bacterium]
MLEYFGIRSGSYYHSEPAIAYNSSDPMPYYLDQTRRAVFEGPSTEDGLPLYRHPEGLEVLPVMITAWGLGHIDVYRRTGSNESLDLIRSCASWLVKHQQDNGAWLNGLPAAKFGLTTPHVSAMTQGLAISFLLRAGRILGEPKHTTVSVKALGPFARSIQDDGVTSRNPEGPFYEEYPGVPTRHVLNGFIFAMLGLHDLVRFEDVRQAAELFAEGLTTLKSWLPRFDLGYWSLYHIPESPRNPATIPYHRLHVSQLKILHAITGDEIFAEYHERWNGYLESRFNALRTLPAKLNWILRAR